MACCGDVPTMETLAAVEILRVAQPNLKVRVVNVVDLMKLQPASEHPHGMSDKEFDALFTTDKPIIFAFHGYPWLIHRLTYRRTNHHNLHVRGYKEEGTTTTPFDMVVLNDLDRFHLVADVVDRVPQLGARAAYLQAGRCGISACSTSSTSRSMAPTCLRSGTGSGAESAVMAVPRVVALFDVDNTLMDNDRITADLTQHLDEEIGTRGSASIGPSSKNCGKARIRGLPWARCSAIGRSIPAIPICCWPCPGSC